MTLRPRAATPPEELLLGFARALRAAGVAVTADRERTYLEAVAAVGLDDQPAVYWAGRATLCASPADLERYDLVFAAWFSGQRAGTKDRPPTAATLVRPGRPRRHRERRRRRATTTRTSFARRRARPRCCATATSPTLTRREREPLARAVRRRCARAPRAGARTGTRRPGAVPSTPAPPCARTLRRMGEPGEVALAPPRHPGRARSCCSSTSPGR